MKFTVSLDQEAIKATWGGSGLAARPYPPGSRPCFLMSCPAAGVVKNLLSAAAASGSLAALWIAPENTVRY